MIEQWLTQFVFYSFAGLLVFSALMVILSANAVRSALFLVLAFFASAGLWLMLEAEFLALVLIIVYVGAVMTLFLFVIMMLNVNLQDLKQQFVRYLPFGLLAAVVLIGLMLMAIGRQHFGAVTGQVASAPANYSNIKELGDVLYTEYAYPFEIAGVLLLVAIISAISLVLRGPQQRKVQQAKQQLSITREQRVRLVKMQAEKPDEEDEE